MLKNIIITLALTLSAIGIRAVNCEIRGSISNAEGRKVYLISYPNNGYQYRDSAVISNGKFAMSIKSVIADRWGIALKDTQHTTITFIEEGTVTLEGDANDPENIVARGTVSNDAYAEYYKEKAKLDKKYTQWFITNSKASEAEKAALMGERKTIDEDMRKLNKRYAEKNRDNLCGLVLMGLDNDMPYDIIDSIVASLPESNKDNEIVRVAMELSKNKKSLLKGKPAPEIVAKDIDGNEVTLSSFRGKYVLIDFWASWCHPCRREIPNVRAEYEKYKDKGFTVLAVSTDMRRADWIKALEAEKMTWPNVIDADGSIATRYNVTTIPHTVLVDKDGKILHIKLRGARLTEELEKIFR